MTKRYACPGNLVASAVEEPAGGTLGLDKTVLALAVDVDGQDMTVHVSAVHRYFLASSDHGGAPTAAQCVGRPRGGYRPPLDPASHTGNGLVTSVTLF